jgi:antirestriction protein ArdC
MKYKRGINKMENLTENRMQKYLVEAVSRPGVLSTAYSAFNNYSLGNQIAAFCQLTARGLPISPIASYKAWQEKGRNVKKGEKALSLCMPIVGKKTNKETGEEEVYTFFAWKNNWFSLDQTEGADYVHEISTPEWDSDIALQALNITQGSFNHIDGNCQGYASGRSIAINPLAEFPHKTRFHEIAHVVLGHCEEVTMSDSDKTPKDIKEVEAESVAYILCSLLGLPGLEESRGYIQSWLVGNTINEKSAQKIFAAADKILKAGKRQEVTA